MRIMEITSGLECNGAVNHCRLLVRHLARRGHSLVLVCRPEAWIARQLASDPIEIVPSQLRHWVPRDLAHIAETARERGVEVLHTHMSRAHACGALVGGWKGLPVVATAHCRFIQLHWALNDMVIAVSEDTARFHRRYNLVSSRRLRVIPNFVDLGALPPDLESARISVRLELGIEPSALVVGTAGRVVPEKGMLALVQAFPRVAGAFPQAVLLIVGGADPNYRGQITEEAARRGVSSRVVWTGHRDDIARVMAAMDLFALISKRETSGLVLLEAMAVGLPLVATRVGYAPRVVNCAKAGTLVSGSEQELADTLVRLLGNEGERRAQGENGRRMVHRHFTSEVVVPRIEEALHHACTHPRRRRHVAESIKG